MKVTAKRKIPPKILAQWVEIMKDLQPLEYTWTYQNFRIHEAPKPE